MTAPEGELPQRVVLRAQRGLWIGGGVFLIVVAGLNFFVGRPLEKDSFVMLGNLYALLVFMLRPRRPLWAALGALIISVFGITLLSAWSPFAARVVWIASLASFGGLLIANGIRGGSYVVLDLIGIQFVDFWRSGTRLEWRDITEVRPRSGLFSPTFLSGNGKHLGLQQDYGKDRDEMFALIVRFHERGLAEAKR